MTTWTYPVDTSETPRSDLTTREVAEERLGHDGYEYELRRENDGWQMYRSPRSRNSYGGAGPMKPAWAGRKMLFSLAETAEGAWAELAPVIARSDWAGIPVAMTDADYRDMLAALAAEEADHD